MVEDTTPADPDEDAPDQPEPVPGGDPETNELPPALDVVDEQPHD